MPRRALETVDQLIGRIAEHCAKVPRRVQVMEICGTHTVSIFRSGLRSRLPENLRLVSGPGCPVCVTAQRHIDAAIELARDPSVIIATYGDMIRVPGRSGNLEQMRASGADVRVVTSARACLDLARSHRERTIVFLAVGFETTAPATAATIVEADREGIENFCVVMCHKLVVPAMEALLDAGDVPLDGFIAPGHVSVIIGADAYLPIVEKYRRPVVVTGFEPLNIAAGLERITGQVAAGDAGLDNVYGAAVSAAGNRVAFSLFEQVFEIADTPWRELGVIPRSGFELAPRFQRFDALRRFGITPGSDENHPGCRCGEVICGKVEPPECALFARPCTPLTPIGPCMVSSEGTCAAWYKYSRVAVTGASG